MFTFFNLALSITISFTFDFGTIEEGVKDYSKAMADSTKNTLASHKESTKLAEATKEFKEIATQTIPDVNSLKSSFKGLGESTGETEKKVKKLTESFTDLSFLTEKLGQKKFNLAENLLFEFDLKKSEPAILAFENQLTEKFTEIPAPLLPTPEFTQPMSNVDLFFKTLSEKVETAKIEIKGFAELLENSVADAIIGVSEAIGGMLGGVGSVSPGPFA